jgi:hypothetical protein
VLVVEPPVPPVPVPQGISARMTRPALPRCSRTVGNRTRSSRSGGCRSGGADPRCPRADERRGWRRRRVSASEDQRGNRSATSASTAPCSSVITARARAMERVGEGRAASDGGSALRRRRGARVRCFGPERVLKREHAASTPLTSPASTSPSTPRASTPLSTSLCASSSPGRTSRRQSGRRGRCYRPVAGAGDRPGPSGAVECRGHKRRTPGSLSGNAHHAVDLGSPASGPAGTVPDTCRARARRRSPESRHPARVRASIQRVCPRRRRRLPGHASCWTLRIGGPWGALERCSNAPAGARAPARGTSIVINANLGE